MAPADVLCHQTMFKDWGFVFQAWKWKKWEAKVLEPGLNLCRKVGNAELRPVVSFDKTVTILS